MNKPEQQSIPSQNDDDNIYLVFFRQGLLQYCGYISCACPLLSANCRDEWHNVYTRVKLMICANRLNNNIHKTVKHIDITSAFYELYIIQVVGVIQMSWNSDIYEIVIYIYIWYVCMYMYAYICMYLCIYIPGNMTSDRLKWYHNLPLPPCPHPLPPS